MKTIISTAMLAISLSASAQITLEHTYNNNSRMEVVNIDGEGYKYIGVENSTKKVIIYNTDHTVWKTITTSIPATANMYTLPTFASKELFNADSKVEVAVIYSDGGGYKIEVYNEDGNSLVAIPNAAWYDVKKVGTQWKMLVHKFNGSNPQYSEVYSLPGQFTGVLKQKTEGAETELFPNPMSNAATLRYNLPTGVRNGEIRVFSANGTMVRNYQVSDQFNDILISRDELPAGIYTYQLSAPGATPSAERFVIQ